MALAERNAPRRGGISFAEIRQVMGLLRRAVAVFKPRGVVGRIRVNAHIARDIGLSPHELELLHHRWPSEEARHPRL